MNSDDEQMLMALFIQNQRIYDLLYAQLVLQDENTAVALKEMHAQGKFFAPDVSYIPDE